MLKQILIAKMLIVPLNILAMNGEKLSLIVHHKNHIPCPLSFKKTINERVHRLCIFTEILQGNPDHLPEEDMVILMAEDMYNEQPKFDVSKVFYEMAEPWAQPIIFRLIIKLDIVVALQAL